MTASASLRLNEAERIAAVRRYDILDTPPDGSFDRISALAARLLGTPIAIVSVVDRDRIWFKSHHGIDVEQVDRAPGLCASAILGSVPWIVGDAAVDPRTMTNPLVAGDLGLRFYAGVPLRTHDGFNLGTLCVLDVSPRQISSDETRILSDLASVVMDELELRLAARRAISLEESRRADVEELATALQASLLPPSLPNIPFVEMAAYYRPANRRQVGGDFYDVFPIDNQSWGLVIGDVCGKGSKAAALTSRARYALRAAAIGAQAPSEVLRVVNQALLTEASPEEPFVTAIFARIEPGPGRTVVHFAVGGHPLPTLLQAGGDVATVGEAGSLLGVMADGEFVDSTLELGPGDTVVMTTDGVLDSGDRPGPLDQAGLEQLLRGCRGMRIPQVVERIHQAVDSAQRDDIAIIGVSGSLAPG